MLYIHILVNNGLAKIYLFEIAPKTVEIKYYLNKITELMENFNYNKIVQYQCIEKNNYYTLN